MKSESDASQIRHLISKVFACIILNYNLHSGAEQRLQQWLVVCRGNWASLWLTKLVGSSTLFLKCIF